MDEEFKFLGLKVPMIAIVGGSILVSWGIIAYILQDSEPKSFTAMIPSIMGMPLLILGVLSERDASRKHHYMHISMLFALIITVGGIRIFTVDSPSILLLISHLMLILVGSIFLFAGIRSFRYNRLLREKE